MPCSKCDHLLARFLTVMDMLQYADRVNLRSSPAIREACRIALRKLEYHVEMEHSSIMKTFTNAVGITQPTTGQ